MELQDICNVIIREGLAHRPCSYTEHREWSYCQYDITWKVVRYVRDHFLELYTTQPDGEEYKIGNCDPNDSHRTGLNIEHGPWTYRVCKTIQYFEELEFSRLQKERTDRLVEEKAVAEKEAGVYNWFINNREI